MKDEFVKPYVDKDEWRQGSVRYHYIHGGFEGTETKFSFFFPEKDDYRGRFFQFVAPVQGSEDASIRCRGEEDKIAFAVTNGAYFVETNMGVAIPFAPIADPTIIYRASAAAAEYSREIAVKLYGGGRPYGYIYGGSGGGFKSTSCLENTKTWDGAVPYIIGSPMAIPCMFTVRAHAKRLLRKKFHLIVDAIEPGGDGNVYAGLNEEEKAALKEATDLGFPLKTWFWYKTIDDGALPVLLPGVNAIDPSYYEDFWKVPGYLGADPNGSAVRDRVCLKTSVMEINIPQSAGDISDSNKTGADESWQRLRNDAAANLWPWLRPAEIPEGEIYMGGMQAVFLSGEAKGYRVPIEKFEEGKAFIGTGFGLDDMFEKLKGVKPGDEIKLDNSDYIAIQTYHRHQVPDRSFAGWEQFRDKDGNPLYPQRPALIGPKITAGGAGSLQSGRFEGKMIVMACLMDESALPWQADWYRNKVKEHLGGGEKEKFRLWYMDNAVHGDMAGTVDELHVVSYLGALHQALLDLSDWVEKGIAPPDSTEYRVKDAQVYIPERAADRKGIQPVIRLEANGGVCARVSVGEPVYFSAEVELPPGAGKLTAAEWSFEGEQDYPVKGLFSNLSNGGSAAKAGIQYIFNKPGIYFPVLRVKANRDGNAGDIFTQVKNLYRVRVIVE